jgi:hypothetical protein
MARYIIIENNKVTNITVSDIVFEGESFQTVLPHSDHPKAKIGDTYDPINNSFTPSLSFDFEVTSGPSSSVLYNNYTVEGESLNIDEGSLRFTFSSNIMEISSSYIKTKNVNLSNLTTSDNIFSCSITPIEPDLPIYLNFDKSNIKTVSGETFSSTKTPIIKIEQVSTSS